MAKSFRGGMPGGFNMGQMMQQAQRQMQQLQQQQAALEAKEFSYSVGGGSVNIKCNGKKEILDLQIDKAVIDPEDPEMLSDLLLTALRGVFAQVDEAAGSISASIPGLSNLGGLF